MNRNHPEPDQLKQLMGKATELNVRVVGRPDATTHFVWVTADLPRTWTVCVKVDENNCGRAIQSFTRINRMRHGSRRLRIEALAIERAEKAVRTLQRL